MKENNGEWDEFTDVLAWIKGTDKSEVQLRRKYLKIWPEGNVSSVVSYMGNLNGAGLAAKGISAFLSFENKSEEFGRSLRFLMRYNQPFNYDNIFNTYYDCCFKFLANEQKKLLPPKRKSDNDLIMFHLQNEVKLFSESKLLFDEVLMTDKPIIKEIKEAALYYREWVKETHIKGKENTPEISIPSLKDNINLKQKARDLLVVLSGCWINGEKIMTDEEYKKVVERVLYLIDEKQLNPIDKKIQTAAPMQFIRRLFWTINNALYTTKSTKKDCFVTFLHLYFECFSDSEKKTTNNNFKEYRNGDFDKDYKKVIESINK